MNTTYTISQNDSDETGSIKRRTLVVIGGGAAGFFCAITAARLNPNLQVTILEKSSKLLSKVRISGGGRCNVTHNLDEIEETSTRYPRGLHFVKKTFHQFFTTDTVEWFRERGVILKTEEDGRMFPTTDSSQTVIDCFLREAEKFGVQIRMNFDVRRAEHADPFKVYSSNGTHLTADYVCIACGAYPKSAGFQWLKDLGHTVEEPVPSLFTFNLPKHPITSLMGVSVDPVRLKIAGTRLVENGPLLATHWGLSGPAVLRLSAWGARELAKMDYAFRVHISWLPSQNEGQLKGLFAEWRRTSPSKKLSNVSVGLPSRLWSFLLGEAGVGPDTRVCDLLAKTENKLVQLLLDYVVAVAGKTTFKEEFVTAGGISLREVDANTMMSKKVPRLFFAGEVLDVDGITGGFNFQHAWTSGWIVANSIRVLEEPVPG